METTGVAKLTERQREVLRLVCLGCTQVQAANRLYLSPRTIKHHLVAAYEKLGIGSMNRKTSDRSGKSTFACYLLGMVDGLDVVDPDGQVLRRVIDERQPVDGTHRDTV